MIMTEFRIVEVFESLQGEGYNTGMQAIFIRFAGCNLNCAWCDTDFKHYQRFSLDSLLKHVKQYRSRNIIITGGEPTQVKSLPLLLAQLKDEGYFIAIESNGLGIVDKQIDYIALSPKYSYQSRYQKTMQTLAHEVRIVVENPIENREENQAEHQEKHLEQFRHFCLHIEKNIKADHYFLSPCEQNGQFNMLQTIQLLGKLNENRMHNKWLLSLQTHKLAHIE